MAMIALWLAAMAAPPVELGPSWARFSRKPALRSEKTIVEIGTLGFDREQGQLDFWLRRTVSDAGVEKTTWTDSRTCPSVRPALAGMRSLPVPRLAPPGLSEGPPIIMDGVSYRLSSYSDEGRLTIKTNVGTPLAAWVDGTLQALDACWKSTIPTRTR